MDYKVEYKKLKKELFEVRFNADMSEYKNNNSYSYKEIIENIKDSLFDVGSYHLITLKDLVKKYSFETIEKYFLSLKKENE